MLWCAGVWDFFKECLNNSEATLSVLPCRATRPCADLVKKHLSEDEAILEGGAILRYHFRVRVLPRVNALLPPPFLLLLCYSVGCARSPQKETVPAGQSTREPYPPLTGQFDIPF
jgi:hypothetical protein